MKDDMKEMLRFFNRKLIELMAEKLTPVKIRKDGLVTVVFWQDGTATSVRCGAGETYDDYVAFCAALAKKLFLSNSAIKRVLKNTPVDVINQVLLTDENKPAVVKPSVTGGTSYTFNISSIEVKDLD